MVEAFQERVGALFSPSALAVNLKAAAHCLARESGTYVWVGHSWQDSHSHSYALVGHHEHFISSC